jgi:hypothetical protein
MKYAVMWRERVTRNTDPLRRCYDGCHFSSVTGWSEWDTVCEYSSKAVADDSAATFGRINPSREYKVEPTEASV